MSESSELCCCEKIFEFRRGRWHPSHDLVATNAGKHDTIPLGLQTRPELRGRASISARIGQAAVTGNLGRWLESGDFLLILHAHIDVTTDAGPLFFDFGEVGTFIPVAFGVVIH